MLARSHRLGTRSWTVISSGRIDLAKLAPPYISESRAQLPVYLPSGPFPFWTGATFWDTRGGASLGSRRIVKKYLPTPSSPTNLVFVRTGRDFSYALPRALWPVGWRYSQLRTVQIGETVQSGTVVLRSRSFAKVVNCHLALNGRSTQALICVFHSSQLPNGPSKNGWKDVNVGRRG